MRKLLAVLVIASWAAVAHAQTADLIVTNAKIVTLDPASTIAQALAVREGRIVVVGGLQRGVRQVPRDGVQQR